MKRMLLIILSLIMAVTPFLTGCIVYGSGFGSSSGDSSYVSADSGSDTGSEEDSSDSSSEEDSSDSSSEDSSSDSSSEEDGPAEDWGLVEGPITHTGVSSFDDGYALTANWIWANTPVKEAQWVALRKTFSLKQAPTRAIARMSADSKYWLWINGELAVFEGQLKLGDSIETWYYDEVDITKYLVKGENSIAVQVYYSGKTTESTLGTGVPGFLFDADIDGARLRSDTDWKAVLDVAYEEPTTLNDNRIGERDIKYNASSAMVDNSGKAWTEKGYNDRSWNSAVSQDTKITSNRINDEWGVYYKNLDPRLNLIPRSVPHVKLEEISKFTASGSNTWTKTSGNFSFAPLSLPDTYTLEAEVTVAEPLEYAANQPTGAAIGLCVCVADNNNFYMPQISFSQADIFDGVAFKPHIKQSGAWSVSSQDLTTSELGKSLYVKGSHDNRYNTKHTVRIQVSPYRILTYLNDTLVGQINDSKLARAGSTIGIRQDINELINIYSLKVFASNGQELYNANIEDCSKGDTINRLSLLNAEYANYPSLYNVVDKSGEAYIPVRNGCVAVNNGNSSSVYKIVNRTNIQGTPYLKVRSESGGELISIKSDAWVNGDRSAIAHQYITKAGEQNWEALGWMNGYEITFIIPDSVEVLELGYRESGYDTEETGLITTNNNVLNDLYREAYDTLYVCMRDSYMDCPDRERCQWLGDAVINMQQAAYAMDEQAALLYKKTLTQAIGFATREGAIPSMVASIKPNLELPMQSLAGVHSFWQYYMYYGDKELMTDSYPALIKYLKLWGISDNGVITHRTGTWDWIDWGEHYDTKIIENCWYYIALGAVLNIANLEGSGATAADIQFLTNRMSLIERNFDALYWNADKNAYYYSTDNNVADDRANALAIYSGLADASRYDGILNVLKSTYNASPYMEKYVLESMYMMGANEDAVQRTLNRFTPFLADGYPTLPEIWADQSLFGGDETKNHAWTGAPLSLLYMYNAGITPMSPAFKTVQIRPHLGGQLNNVSATVERANGKILVSVEKTTKTYTLNVTLPSASLGGVIYVPRIDGVDTMIKLNGTVLYANGAPISANMPSGVSYAGEDTDFVAFNVTAGTYNFVSEENTVAGSSTCQVVINAVNGGSIKVNGTTVNSFPYTVSVSKGASVAVQFIPNDGYRLMRITGSYPETIVSDATTTRNYVVNSNMTLNVLFEEILYDNKTLKITTSNTELAKYALSVYVNGELVSLPYSGAYSKGTQVSVLASADESNYSVTINGEAATQSTLTLSGDCDLVIGITEKSTVNKISIASVTASDNSLIVAGWAPAYLIDGIKAPGATLGYTTNYTTTNNISANPHVLTFNLGSLQTINQVAMFPRTDSWAADSSLSCCFPVDFTISVSTDGVNYTTVVTVVNGENPRFKQQCYDFTSTQAQYVKLTVTKLGLPPYDDGTNNDHYRLQLAEFEVYYNTELS